MKIACSFFGLFFLPFLILASDNENNLTWIENNLNSIFDSLEIAEYSGPGNTQLDFGKLSGEKFGFIRNQVIQYIVTRHDSSNIGADTVLIRIEQFDVAIVYQQSSAGFLNLQTETQRKNTIHLSGWLEKKSAAGLLKSLNVNKTFSDKLTTDDISELEESPYTFTRGVTVEPSLWVNVMEPLMVASSVAFLVYLFFSVRS